MRRSNQHPFLRPRRLNSYLAYSIGCGIAWAVVLSVTAAADNESTFHAVLLVFLGWVIGWTSASIARLVYPPPKKRSSAGPSSFFQGFRDA